MGKIESIGAASSGEEKSPVLIDIIRGLVFDPEDSLTAAHYGVLFNRCDKTVYDTIIRGQAERGEYVEVIRTKRKSELAGYESPVIDEHLKQALSEIGMLRSLPNIKTAERQGFLVTKRFLLHGYRYAAERNYLTEKWDPAEGCNTFASCFQAHGNRGFLGCDPSTEEIYAPYFRYYDENMEPLDVFLFFDEILADVTGESQTNIDAEMAIWETVNTTHWTGDHYYYKPSVPVYECETGFFLLAAKFNNILGSKLPYFERSLTDIYTRLLKDQWDSPNWRDYVSRHADTNEQKRLNSTIITFMVLHTYYRIMPADAQTAFRELLTGGEIKAWEGLVNYSGLYQDHQFCMNDTYGSLEPTDRATALGAMLLFLQGVVPETGSLAVPLIEEEYEDELAGLVVSHFAFDAADNTIHIPVWKGSINFHFGTDVVTADFSADGLYVVRFGKDWNSISDIEKIGGLPADKYRYIV